MNQGYNHSTSELHSNDPFSNGLRECWPIFKSLTSLQKPLFHEDASDSKRFPFSNFTFCLTLFSEFFSSFPHGTCSLSVSRQYLALEGVYLPLEQHSQTTRLWENASHKHWESTLKTGLLPSLILHQRTVDHYNLDMVQCGWQSLQFTTRTVNDCQISKLSSSLFTRRYWGNPC
jgi:hypothetical protein